MKNLNNCFGSNRIDLCHNSRSVFQNAKGVNVPRSAPESVDRKKEEPARTLEELNDELGKAKESKQEIAFKLEGRLEKEDLSRINQDKLVSMLIQMSLILNTQVPAFLENKTIPAGVLEQVIATDKISGFNKRWVITMALGNPNIPLKFLRQYSTNTPENRKTREGTNYLLQIFENPSTPKEIKDSIFRIGDNAVDWSLVHSKETSDDVILEITKRTRSYGVLFSVCDRANPPREALKIISNSHPTAKEIADIAARGATWDDKDWEKLRAEAQKKLKGNEK